MSNIGRTILNGAIIVGAGLATVWNTKVFIKGVKSIKNPVIVLTEPISKNFKEVED